MAKRTRTTTRTTAKQTGHKKASPAQKKRQNRKKGPEYTHLTKLRCPRCGVVMRAVGTREEGRVKRWLCPAPVCRKRTQTIGEEI